MPQRKEVIAALKESRFDVLFLDIQMPGTDGFEVFEQIGTVHMPVTVFVTAHNHYAVQAFEVHALDYLTKPVGNRSGCSQHCPGQGTDGFAGGVDYL